MTEIHLPLSLRLEVGDFFRDCVKAKEDKMLEDFEEDGEDYISESEDESDNDESHEESLDEDDELL